MIRDDPIGYPPRGMSRELAARYVGVSPRTFDDMVNCHAMPRPRRWKGRNIWDRVSVDLAFEALEGGADEEVNEIDAILSRARARNLSKT